MREGRMRNGRSEGMSMPDDAGRTMDRPAGARSSYDYFTKRVPNKLVHTGDPGAQALRCSQCVRAYSYRRADVDVQSSLCEKHVDERPTAHDRRRLRQRVRFRLGTVVRSTSVLIPYTCSLSQCV